MARIRAIPGVCSLGFAMFLPQGNFLVTGTLDRRLSDQPLDRSDPTDSPIVGSSGPAARSLITRAVVCLRDAPKDRDVNPTATRDDEYAERNPARLSLSDLCAHADARSRSTMLHCKRGHTPRQLRELMETLSGRMVASHFYQV